MRLTSFLMKRAHRAPQNENNVPFKVQMPLELKKRVANTVNTRERGCVHELSLVLNCLVQNNYENKFCTKEVDSFQQCYKGHMDRRRAEKEQSRKGVLTPNAKTLTHTQANLLLKQYPPV